MKKEYVLKLANEKIYLTCGEYWTRIYVPMWAGSPNCPGGFWNNRDWAKSYPVGNMIRELEDYYHDNRDSIIEECKKLLIKEML